MSAMHLMRLDKGVVLTPGRRDVAQSWCYLPDWARAAVALAEQRDRLETFTDVPFPGHAFSVDALAEGLSAVLNRPIRIKRFPWWLMRVASPVWGLAREMQEMRYLWDLDHRLDGARFEQLCGDIPQTPLSEVLRKAAAAKGVGAAGSTVLGAAL